MRTFLIVLAYVFSGCGGQDGNGHPNVTKDQWELELEPPTSLDNAHPVLALKLTGDPDVPPLDPLLVVGEPSKASIGRYEEGETSDALAERIVPTVAESSPGQLLIRPRHTLALGQKYMLLSRTGVLGTLWVRPTSELSHLVRVWPPRESDEPTTLALYCGDAAPTLEEQIEVFPTGRFGRLALGLDDQQRASETCVRLLVDGATGEEVQPPTHRGNFSFEPTPFRAGANTSELTQPTCVSPSAQFGPGCLKVEGGYGTVQNPAGTKLWVLRSAPGWHSTVVEGGGTFGFPMSEGTLGGYIEAVVFDLAGRTSFAFATVEPRVPMARVIVNEVLSNPRGAEPGEEWIELLNSGTASATMVGWKLLDQAGEVELPRLILPPGAFILLVRHDFRGGQAGDVAPRANTTIVRLASLGKNGLANGGEAVSLRDESGAIVSTFPARSSYIEGTSIARRSPDIPDDAANGFGPHAAPGASPGAQNVVE